MMIAWKQELAFLRRYSIAGILNAVVGLGSIYLLMGLGVSALVANVVGYGLALGIAYMTGRNYVFKSNGHLGTEGMRYLAAFFLCFVCNLFALQLALKLLCIGPWLAQGLANSTYVAGMFLCGRFFVFTTARNRVD